MTRMLLLEVWTATVLAATTAFATDAAAGLDIRRAAPPEAYLAVYVQNNPERDAHWPHWQQVFERLCEEKIGVRLHEVVTSRMDEEDLAAVESAVNELQQAVASTSFEAILNAEHVMYAQVMEMPSSQHLLALQLTQQDAEGLAQAFQQFFEVIESWSDGKATVAKRDVGGVELTTLETPERVRVRPAVALLDNMVLVTTREQLLLDALKRLGDSTATSKFDDKRLQEALSHLPAAEDAIVYYDGQAMFRGINQLGPMIRENARDQENAERVVEVISAVIHAVDIIDYEVTVEYTDGFQQRTATLGKFTDDAREKMLYRAIAQGQPFDEWEEWIPADASTYALHTGVRLSVVYEWAIELLRDHFPETHEGLAKWESIQKELDVDVQADLLKPFTGECVAISLPVVGDDGQTTTRQVSAFRCTDAPAIVRLLERAIDALNRFPAVEAQGLQLVPSDQFDGFHELRANFFTMLDVSPIVGAFDGWLVVADSPAAIERIQAVRAGETPSVVESPPWQRLDLDVSGEVYALKYADVGAAVERAAQTVEQIAAFAPIAVGMLGAQTDPEVAAAVNEVIAVLPSVAKVIRELDFLEDSLSVTRRGPLENSYRTDWALQLEAARQ